MSIIDTFDDCTDAIIHPHAISPHIDGFPEIAVVAFSEQMITALTEDYAATRIDALQACVSVPVYRVNYAGQDMAIYCTTVGGPACAGLLEVMIAKGCRKFVFFGSCGVLDRDIAAQSLIVPTAAYRDEGTSYHYAPPSEYIEVMTARRLSAIISELGLPHVCGKTWTTDAIYRETRGNMEQRKREGCISVEMECASLMAVAQFRHVAAYQFLYAADSLTSLAWDPRTLGRLPRDDNARLLRIALEVAARV
ncbi:MAG: nucleoside phosphorylase [Peptococcaceae bacterium]|nr:nucleoside phosphorylase [Peptococcaceae bacterium]